MIPNRERQAKKHPYINLEAQQKVIPPAARDPLGCKRVGGPRSLGERGSFALPARCADLHEQLSGPSRLCYCALHDPNADAQDRVDAGSEISV